MTTIDPASLTQIAAHNVTATGAATTDDTTDTQKVSGAAAQDAAVAGNPVLVGGRGSSASPTAVSANGDAVAAWMNLRGATVIAGATTNAAGSGHATNVVLGAPDGNGYPLQVSPNPMLFLKLTADGQVKASAGILHTVTFSCNDAAPTAGSVIIYDSLTETGTEIFNHTFTTTPFVPFTLTFNAAFATGLYVGFTTTADVNVTVTYR